MRLRFVTAIVRSRAASPADSWSASGRAISAPASTTSVDSGRSRCHSQNQAKAANHGSGQPKIAPGEDDRPPGFLLVGIDAEGEQQTERDQTVQSEDEQRSNEHDHGQDGQHQPSPDPGLSGRRRKYGPLRRRGAGGERRRGSLDVLWLSPRGHRACAAGLKPAGKRGVLRHEATPRSGRPRLGGVRPDSEATARPAVRVNQLGYLPGGPKWATLVSESLEPINFDVLDEGGRAAYSGQSRPWPVRPEPTSGLDVHLLDFSDLTTSGSFHDQGR